MAQRYAVYYMPDEDSALGRFGARLFGRWPDGRELDDTLDHPERDTRTGRAARYGFHATLKAPFRLAQDRTATELRDAVEAIAGSSAPIDLGRLQVERFVQGSDTWALCCAADPNRAAGRDAALQDLATRCVSELDHLRAPLDSAERARRRPAELSPLARERLERWGYPWVLGGFRFHITLARADRAAPSAGQTDMDHEPFGRWLRTIASAALRQPAVLDRLAIVVEDDAGAPFRRIAAFPLTANR